jgi:hypothetical protein
MPSSELADRSHHDQRDWLRALLLTIALPVLMVASVIIGAPASQGPTAVRDLNRQETLASSAKPAVTAVPAWTTTTAPPTTTTTLPPPATATAPATTPVPAPAPQIAPAAPAAPSDAATPTDYGCAAALAYLAANANPEFSFECPGYADGNAAMTCVNHDPECPGEHLIVIADPCPAAYMNEAYNSNSWSDATGTFTRPIDPYGSC